MVVKKGIYFGIFALLGIFVYFWIQPYLEMRLPDQFQVEKLAFDIEADVPDFPIPDLTEVTKQKFYYLGHGGQAVAFVSEDAQFVLKFFLIKSLHGKKRFPIPKPTHWISSHREKRSLARKKRALSSLHKALKNYTVAYSRMPEKTAILGLHLKATHKDLPKVTLVDRENQEYTIDLNRVSFIFQKKAALVQDKLRDAATDEEKMHLLSNLNTFFAERAKLGFIDIERSFMIESNYGFVGDTPIQLDAGNIEYLSELEMSPTAEIDRIQSLLHHWAKERCLPRF